MHSRRVLLGAGLATAAVGLAGCAAPPTSPLTLVEPEPTVPIMPTRYGPILDEPYPIRARSAAPCPRAASGC